MLMERAQQRAQMADAEALSLIVSEENTVARQLYEKLGYQAIARRPVVPHPRFPHTGDWLLMKKEVAPHA